MQNLSNGTLASYGTELDESSTPVVVIDAHPQDSEPYVLVMAIADKVHKYDNGFDHYINKGFTFFAHPQDLTGDLVAYRP